MSAFRAQEELVALGQLLLRLGYRFVAPTPATHARVLARDTGREARDLRDVLGWNRPFRQGAVSSEAERWLEKADVLEALPGGFLKSRVRFATLGAQIFVHSAFPTTSDDAVFFGPDTYRFARFLALRAPRRARRVVDVGAGSGAGGLSLPGDMGERVLADINPAALEACRVNLALAGATSVRVVKSDLLADVAGPVDLLVMNPPYLVDASRRAYRHGGEGLGTELSLRFVEEGLRRLEPGGTLLLYTASPIQDGQDPLRESLRPLLERRATEFLYEELDPDVFGEELATEPYLGVDRLALVGLVARRA